MRSCRILKASSCWGDCTFGSARVAALQSWCASAARAIGFAELVRECGTRNRQLLQGRDELQSRIDQYHRERSGVFLLRGDRMNRREFITVLGGAAAWPLAGQAQQSGRTYKLAVLTANLRDAPQNLALLEELWRRGFIEGQNVTVRGFGLRSEQLPEFAIEFVKEGVDAILCGGGPATRAAQVATRTDTGLLAGHPSR